MLYIHNMTQDEKLPVSAYSKVYGFYATLGILLGIIALWMLLQILIETLFLWLFSGAADHPPAGRASLLLALVYIVPGMLVLYLVAVLSKRKNPSIPEYLALRRMKFTRYVLWVVAFGALAVAMDWFCHLTGRLLGSEVLYQAVAGGRYRPLLFTAVLFAAPVIEEVIFRGFAYRGLSNTKYGPAPAILITSLIWALIHAFVYDAVLIAMIFCAGIVLGIARMRLKSIYPTIVMHSAMNLIALVQITYVIV